jgi:hypothetical protein
VSWPKSTSVLYQNVVSPAITAHAVDRTILGDKVAGRADGLTLAAPDHPIERDISGTLVIGGDVGRKAQRISRAAGELHPLCPTRNAFVDSICSISNIDSSSVMEKD